jgi:IS30 family transposase
MLTLEERFMIKEMYRIGVSISEIASRTHDLRNEVIEELNC